MADPDLLINELKQLDNARGYKLSYKTVKAKLDSVIAQIIQNGDKYLDELHKLLENENTWSCLFSLEILKELKNTKSISPLISFICKTEDGDYFEGCENALHALVAIGTPAIELLLEHVKADFANKKYNMYLTSALCEIKDSRVYQFMIEIVTDYISDYKKYDGWLSIDTFTSNFDKQENKECLPLLEKNASMPHLSNNEVREIKDTILVITDPQKFEEESNKIIDEIDKKMTLFKKPKGLSNKFTKQETEDYINRAEERDNDFSTNFVCKDCAQRQNIKTGLIVAITLQDKSVKYLFENEIACKQCYGNNLELSKDGKMQLAQKNIQVLMGSNTGVLAVDDSQFKTEGKNMAFAESYNYLHKRFSDEPNNGELALRIANTARKLNKHGDAITFYEKSLELNPKLISAVYNLVDIYAYRFEYYHIDGAYEKAIYYYNKLIEIYNSPDFNPVTLSNDVDIEKFLSKTGLILGLRLKMIKVGRNEPCPCGSGKKYKKCCMG